MKFRITHITILYFLVGISFLISIFVLSSSSNSIATPPAKDNGLEERVSKLEFQQEYFRIVNNLLGFDQVNNAISSDSERVAHCTENSGLLVEWSDDIENLRNMSVRLNSDENISKSMSTIDSLYKEIQASCSEASS